MRAIAPHFRPILVFTLTSLLTLTLTTSRVSAADQAKKSPTKSIKKTNATQSAKRQPDQAKIVSPTLTAISEDVALSAFDTFTIEWMKKLEQTEEFHRTQAKISQAPDGFSAEYTGYLPHRYIHVKKTEATDTPYVGILTYYERTFRCNAKTKDEVLKGPFDQVETTQVSEIFRFTKGKWVY
jgi:hypothetical protein